MLRFLIFLLLPILAGCSDKEHESNINVLNASSFQFFKIASGKTIPLSASEGNIIYAFGEPDQKTTGVAEHNKFPCIKWIYKGAVVYLQAGRMVDIDLVSPEFGFVFNGKVIEVGENISILKTLFPDSFSSKSNDRLLVGLHYNGEPIESRISFEFNSQNQISTISILN